MLSEDRVILMTQMAMFAEREGKKNEKINGYFRGDYLSLQILKSVVLSTCAYLILVAVYAVYHFEEMIQSFYAQGIVGAGKRYVIVWLLFVGAYSLIALVVYSRRYNRMRREMKAYGGGLRRLEKMYERETGRK